MRLGNTDIASVKLGSSQVQAVYLGSNLVWQNAPVAIAATGVGTTSFTANWNAYSGAYLYLLDVSESSDFSTFVYQNQVIYAPTTSYVVIGLNSNTTYYYRVRASDFELEAQDFFDRVADAGGTLSATEKDAVNILVTDMKADGIWSKMKAIYPMVGASAAACAQNLKSSSFTGIFGGSWNYLSSGVEATAIGAYFDTNLNWNDETELNNSSFGCYWNTFNPTGTVGAYYGCYTIAASSQGRSSAVNADFRLNSAGYYQVPCGLGLHSMTRSGVSTFAYYLNGSLQTGNIESMDSVSKPNLNFWFNGPNGLTPYGRNRHALAYISENLTSTEAPNFYTAVQGFNTTLDRYVGGPWYDNGELLLDAYPDSAAAYSLRKLRNNYIGGPIRVRRSSDNEEQDIYFDANGELDITQLTTFCGAGDGFVKTWYDQSGNGYDAEQTTASSQPQIVNSGTYLGYLDINNRLLTTSMPYTNGVDYSAFKVIKQKGGAVIGATVNTGSVFYAVSDTSGSSSFQNFTSVSYYKNNSLISGTARNSIYNVILNNYVTLTSFVTSQNTQNMTIGYPSYSNFELKEQIIYSNNQLSNISGINTNINDFYSIY
jgi:hypothetical protein